MISLFINLLLYFLFSIVLGTLNVRIDQWQYWALLFLLLAVDTFNYARGLSKRDN